MRQARANAAYSMGERRGESAGAEELDIITGGEVGNLVGRHDDDQLRSSSDK